MIKIEEIVRWHEADSDGVHRVFATLRRDRVQFVPHVVQEDPNYDTTVKKELMEEQAFKLYQDIYGDISTALHILEACLVGEDNKHCKDMVTEIIKTIQPENK